ncbi:uncharacterized protein LOC111264590 isoform X2 [Varroa jacobsoni]|uniref:Uncharacterized protein n=1 Tax=Varroa destructor TaxID=109461 RepID=A0A7M7K6V6_VARDE|nr:uncharacterized protein LOC111250881 isoform X2 [Varroa destructor]XP_022696384.1 uncharacterized protein LOC111264590 isoform X2 [Varroa jacobsoni]
MIDENPDFTHGLNWSVDTSFSRKTSLLEDEREPLELMLDSDVTQQSMDSLDGFNSEAELIKLERCRTIPVSALYDAMRHAEERNRQKLASSRSLSMSSLGSLWDQDYKQRATDYTRELQERENTTNDDDDKLPDKENADPGVLVSQKEQSPPIPIQHSFRLHTPIPEEDCCSSGSNESITYVFMNPQPLPGNGQSDCSDMISFPSSTSSTFGHPLISGHAPASNPSSTFHHRQHQSQNTSRRVISSDNDDYEEFAKRKSSGLPESLPHGVGEQPRTLSMDSIDVEHCMNFINRAELLPTQHENYQDPQMTHAGYQEAPNGYNVETPHTTLERHGTAAGRRLHRENSGIHIESTDHEYPGIEPTPYQVDSAATDLETTGPECPPRLWSLLHRPQHHPTHSHDSGSDYDGNDLPSYRVASLQRPPSQVTRRSSAKIRRKPLRTRAIETQTDEDLTGYSSQPSSPGISRKSFSDESYALMRSITSGGPLNQATEQLAAQGHLEPAVHLLTEVVSLMKMMMANLPSQRCRDCQRCKCCLTKRQDPISLDDRPNSLKSVEHPNFLNLSSLSDTASSDPESTGPAAPASATTPSTAFREGFLIERFRQSRLDRIATACSQSELDAELDLGAPDSLTCDAREGTHLSGASTPTDEFRAFPSLTQLTMQKAAQTGCIGDKMSPTNTADSGISNRWESHGSSCGSTGSRGRNDTPASSESMSGGPSSLSSPDNTPDSSLSRVRTAETESPVLTHWAQLADEPVRTSTPLCSLTTWVEQAKHNGRPFDYYSDQNTQVPTVHANSGNGPTELNISRKTARSKLSRYEYSVDELDSITITPAREVTRPSKLALMKEREQQAERFRNEECRKLPWQLPLEDCQHLDSPKNKKPLDELKKKWQIPYDLIPNDNYLPLPTHTRLRCSPGAPPQGL